MQPVVRGAFTISAAPIIHPDTAVGYRVEAGERVLAYLPDHEPALSPSFPLYPDWTSGAAVANGANAVYLGASMYNARVEGAQLTLDELGQA
jgi:hypothetical protein